MKKILQGVLIGYMTVSLQVVRTTGIKPLYSVRLTSPACILPKIWYWTRWILLLFVVRETFLASWPPALTSVSKATPGRASCSKGRFQRCELGRRRGWHTATETAFSAARAIAPHLSQRVLLRRRHKPFWAVWQKNRSKTDCAVTEAGSAELLYVWLKMQLLWQCIRLVTSVRAYRVRRQLWDSFVDLA